MCLLMLNQHTNLSFNLEWQRPLQMVSHKCYNINANEDFVMFLTSESITCFDTFTSGTKSQSITCLLHTHDFRSWKCSALNMGCVDKWSSRMQGQWFFPSRMGQKFSIRSISFWGLPLPVSTSPGREFHVRRLKFLVSLSCSMGAQSICICNWRHNVGNEQSCGNEWSPASELTVRKFPWREERQAI